MIPKGTINPTQNCHSTGLQLKRKEIYNDESYDEDIIMMYIYNEDHK